VQELNDMVARATRVGIYGAALILAGILLSGPLALLLVNATHPQPPWQGPELFVQNYHPVQSLPFFGGFFLVGGFVLLIASLHASSGQGERALATASLVFVAAFAAMVCINYTVQTTFVPELVRRATPLSTPILSALTMSNPASLAWGLEMWGYGLLGVATWLVAPVFGTSTLERATAWTFVANGPASIIPAFLTALRPGWVMTSAGLAAFVLWNLLVAVMAALALAVFMRTRIGSGRESSVRVAYSRPASG
jgi:hypothetical protein